MSEVDYKIAIREWVRHRLDSNPAAIRIASSALDLYVVPDFLSKADCAALIRMIDRNCEPSKLLAPTGDSEFRTSESCNMDPADKLVARIEKKLTALLDITPAHGETIQGQRYSVGQQFKPHYDYFDVGHAYWAAMDATGGQRTWTAMAFLNDSEGGGETFFPQAGIKVKPKTGNLLVWNNLDAEGAPNLFSLHQGMPVTAGVKYIVTKWHRERPWIAHDVPVY